MMMMMMIMLMMMTMMRRRMRMMLMGGDGVAALLFGVRFVFRFHEVIIAQRNRTANKKTKGITIKA